MPSKSVKQAKTMSAIAHGWKPTGEAADIPVGVAREFHAADKGKKYGKKGKSPSNPKQTTPPPSGQAPPVGAGETQGAVDRSSHFRGNPGFAEGRHEKNQDYHAEQREHFGDKAEGSKTATVPHAPQPGGHPIGVPPLGSGQQGRFGPPSTFRGMRGNPTPSSGHPGAHRIGKR